MKFSILRLPQWNLAFWDGPSGSRAGSSVIIISIVQCTAKEASHICIYVYSIVLRFDDTGACGGLGQCTTPFNKQEAYSGERNCVHVLPCLSRAVNSHMAQNQPTASATNQGYIFENSFQCLQITVMYSAYTVYTMPVSLESSFQCFFFNSVL